MRISKGGCSVYPIMVPAKHNLRTFNFYIIEEASTLSLIDAGINTDDCWASLNQTLRDNGFELGDINQVILTHNHEDHVGLLNRISSVKNIPIYAHKESIHRLKRDPAFFAMRVEFFAQLYREMGCGAAGEQQVEKLREAVQTNERRKIQADILPLVNSDRIAGMDVIETPGHSPDHVVLLHEKRRWLFSGDHLLGHISSNALVEPNQEGQRIATLVQYVRSLKKCMTLDAEILYPGHGRLIHNHRELIESRLHRINEKAARIRQMIQNGMTTAAQLAYSYYKDKYNSQFSLVMSEIIGHLDYLESLHKIKKERKNGVWHYVLVV